MATSRWEEVADTYNAIFQRDAYYMGLLNMIANGVDAREGDVILDLGCGTGNLIAVLREKYPEAKVCGVDPAENMVRLCSDRFRNDEGVEVWRGDATRIPFLSEHFDYAVSNIALHHVLPELRPLSAGEIARVLKNGGRLVYADLFTEVEGEREDPARCRDIINKLVGYALYTLAMGAYEKALFLLEQLPRHLNEDEEYVTVVGKWLDCLEEAGFTGIEVIEPPHPEFGFRLIRGENASH